MKYAIFGLKRAKQMIGDKQGTKPIFDYIQKVEDVRHCEDAVAAAALITQNQFTLDHVPGHLLTAQEVCIKLFREKMIFETSLGRNK